MDYGILDWNCDEVPEDHPEHLDCQRVIRERCQELQAAWSGREEYRRRTQRVEPLSVDEVLLEVA
jgi:hypothetical protein